jgi:hypothetical protein
MTRFDLYAHVHKALRALFLETIAAAGRTDFDHPQELPALAANVRRTARIASRHAEHEDCAIHPILHRHAPELAADLEAGHDRYEGLERKLEETLLALEQAQSAQRAPLGRQLAETLDTYVADNLTHMRLEETRANRVLWAHLDDGELIAIQGQILAGMTAEEIEEMVGLMLAAGNARERAALLAALSAKPNGQATRVGAGA